MKSGHPPHGICAPQCHPASGRSPGGGTLAGTKPEQADDRLYKGADMQYHKLKTVGRYLEGKRVRGHLMLSVSDPWTGTLPLRLLSHFMKNP
ncbi:unnamed protein product [Pieris macdunnoughi]|uniref:Uncharacterized protein n=1 Tax=Pieris macdunnoughi TaxID=345717 RepID=A0A821TVG0_9NEOP|nr:unnamed protein product [Pieris macdunnoughi]